MHGGPALARSRSRSRATPTSTASPTAPDAPAVRARGQRRGADGAFAAMVALWWREHGGTGQVIDLSIYEPLFWILGPQASVYDQLGAGPGPDREPCAVHCAAQRLPGCGRPVAGTVGQLSVNRRAGHALGRAADILEEPWFTTTRDGSHTRTSSTRRSRAWIAERDSDEVIRAFEEASAAIAPCSRSPTSSRIRSSSPRDTITTVEHPVLGPLKMQNVIPRSGPRRAQIRSCGPRPRGP